MATRDGKEWLESVTLDEDNMASDSDTDVATQSSIKAYADNVAANAPTASMTLTSVPLSATPYATSTGGMYLVDNSTSTALTLTLPTAVGNTGQRIRIVVGRNIGGLTLDPNGAELIYGETGFETFAKNFCLDLVAVNAPSPDWISVSACSKIVLGNDSSTYPGGIVLIDVAGSDNDIKLETDTGVTGTSDGLKMTCTSHGGYKVESTGGNSYVVVKCPDANTGQMKLVHATSGAEWRITNTANTHLYQLRPGANAQVYVADYNTGQMGIGTISPGVNSPLRIGGVNVTTMNFPVYATNALAKAGGMTDGEIYRKSDGTMMIVYT